MEFIYARDSYGQTLVELGERDSQLVVLDADLSGSTRTVFFRKQFPQRFFNLGVAEQNMMTVAAGLASCGKIVFASTFAMFASTRGLDQIRNTICYNNLNVKIVATHAGITVGEDGASHQALEDIAFLRPIPNMRIIVPCDAQETKEAVISAYKIPGPVYIRLGRAKVPVVENKKEFVVGKGYVVEEGKDLVIFACGIMVYQALLANQLLKQRGISATIVNIHTLKPLDEDLIVECAQKYRCALVCEEHTKIGGLYSAVVEVLGRKYPTRVEGIGVENRFGQSGDPARLLEEYGLSSNHIANKAEAVIRQKD